MCISCRINFLSVWLGKQTKQKCGQSQNIKLNINRHIQCVLANEKKIAMNFPFVKIVAVKRINFLLHILERKNNSARASHEWRSILFNWNFYFRNLISEELLSILSTSSTSSSIIKKVSITFQKKNNSNHFKHVGITHICLRLVWFRSFINNYFFCSSTSPLCLLVSFLSLRFASL